MYILSGQLWGIVRLSLLLRLFLRFDLIVLLWGLVWLCSVLGLGQTRFRFRNVRLLFHFRSRLHPCKRLFVGSLGLFRVLEVYLPGYL